MKKCLRLVSVALAIATPVDAVAQAASVSQLPDAAKLAEAHAIIEIMFPPAERRQTFDKLLDQFTAQYRAHIPTAAMGDAGLKAIVERQLDKSRERLRALLQQQMPGV